VTIAEFLRALSLKGGLRRRRSLNPRADLYRRSSLATLEDYFGYRNTLLHGAHWVAKFVLENGELAYVMADLDVHEEYRCPATSALMLQSRGARFEVVTLPWYGHNVVVKAELVSPELCPRCDDCEILSKLEDVDLTSDVAILRFAEELGRLVSAGKLREVAAESQMRQMMAPPIRLAEIPARRDHVGGLDAGWVPLECSKCSADWVLSYHMDRSVNSWYKSTHSFRFFTRAPEQTK
jgi:hypothetical protein